MLDKLFFGGLDVLAFVLPISIAATNIIFFPLMALWILSSPAHPWRPVWGSPEKYFVVFLMVSFLSAFVGIDPTHSLKEIKNKDFYILIAIVVVALGRDRKQNAHMLSLFMTAALLTAVWGVVQCAVGVNQSDKSGGYFMHLPATLAHWPRPMLNLLSMVDGRVLGTRGHPLAYAECLLFNWAFAICFLLSCQKRDLTKWIVYSVIVGAALLVSQSRGPWIAAAVIALLAMITSRSKRGWVLFAVCGMFVVFFVTIPALRTRAVSILDRSNHSNNERMHMWRAGLQIWKAHPVLGVGPGNVKNIAVSYQLPDEKAYGAWGHLHSTYVNFIVERGILGLLSFIVFLGALVRELWQGLKRTAGDPWLSAVFRACLLGMAGFLISGFTETAYNSAVVMMTFYFVIGMALASVRHPHGSIVR